MLYIIKNVAYYFTGLKSALCISCSVLYVIESIVFCTLHILCGTICSVLYILDNVKCFLPIAYYAVPSTSRILCSVYRFLQMHTIQCIIFCTLHNTYCAVNMMFCPLHTMQCILYITLCILCSDYCFLHTTYFTV